MAMSPKPSRNDINASSSRDTEPPPPPPPHPSSMTDARNLIEDYSRIMLRYTQQQFDAFAVHGNGNSFGGVRRSGGSEKKSNGNGSRSNGRDSGSGTGDSNHR